jgi:hypothetical protein
VRLFWLMAILAPVFLMFPGCGNQTGNKNRPPVVKASGTVTYKQQPVEGATVLFTSTTSGPAATGFTDENGVFVLRTFDPGDGAAAGTYKVSISKFDMSTSNPDREDDLQSELNESDKEPIGPNSLLPARYSSAETSTLEEEVTSSGPNEFKFNLVD